MQSSKTVVGYDIYQELSHTPVYLTGGKRDPCAHAPELLFVD